MFFSKKQKNMARKNSYGFLKERYEASEEALNKSAFNGSIDGLKDNMKIHHDLEYSLLYKTFLAGKKEKRKRKKELNKKKKG